MRQRVIIAMALALSPELIIMDEPTTALDVVVQREILQQVDALKRDFGFAVLFITHDLSLLLEFADRIAIMYAGEIVETAPAERLGANPQHPYTQGLLQSFPPLTGPADPADRGFPARRRISATPERLPLQSALPALPARAKRCSTCGRRPSVRGCARSSRATRSRAISSTEAKRMTTAAPLEVRSLTKRFAVGNALRARARARRRRRVVRAAPGTITALVGESGSGKSTVARLLARLYDAELGSRPLRGERRLARAAAARRPALPLAGADDLPGPVRRRSTR